MKQIKYFCSRILTFMLISNQLLGMDLKNGLQNLSSKLTNVTKLLEVTSQIPTPIPPVSPKPSPKPQPTREPAPAESPKPKYTLSGDFSEWKEACKKLPTYDATIKATDTTPLEKNGFNLKDALDTYFDMMKARYENKIHWLEQNMPDTKPWNEDSSIQYEDIQFAHLGFEIPKIPFVPFVEKFIFKTSDKIAFHGDFHGDVHACIHFIEKWTDEGYIDNTGKITKDDFYIIFLGDYTDRGWYGAEVIYTLLRLKIINPEKVFMVRGNHESLDIIAKYGFSQELRKKFGEEMMSTFLGKITRFYNFLPLALYLECPSAAGNYDVVQCCHGGIELGFDPKQFLESASTICYAYLPTLMQLDGYKQIEDIATDKINYFKNNIETTTKNGFMWSDFLVDPTHILEGSERGAGFVFGKQVTQRLLRNAWSSPSYRLRAVFRAHQHTQSDNDPMKQTILNYNKTKQDITKTAPWYNAPADDAGIAFLWSDKEKQAGSLQDILALTFSVAPGTSYNWPYDAFGLLTLAEGYDNWNIKVYRENY